MARKKLDIPEKEVEKLASYGLSSEDIADFFGVSKSTIDHRFCNVIKKGRMFVKIKLRKKQIDVALKGNVPMLIWLGKQMLGQKESPTEDKEIRVEVIRKEVGS